MFLCFGFANLPKQIILMFHRCIDAYCGMTLCVQPLQRVGGTGEPRAFSSIARYRFYKTACRC